MKIFQERKIIGKGGYSTIYLDERLGQQIVCKLYKNQSTSNDIKLQLFREIKFLKLLKHPNIIELIDIEMNENTIEILQPYYPKTLQMKINQFHSSFQSIISQKNYQNQSNQTEMKIIQNETIQQQVNEIKHIIHQIHEVFQYLHSNYIVHRDIKPDNFLLDSDNTIKLIDFGNAYQIKDNEYISAINCTPNYCPPECTFATRVPPFSIDIFQIGCVIFEMLTNCQFLSVSSDYQLISFLQNVYQFNYGVLFANPSIQSLPENLPLSEQYLNDFWKDFPFELTDKIKTYLNITLNGNPFKRLSMKELQSDYPL